MVGDLLGRLQLAAVLHVRSDAGCPERVISNLRFDLRSLGPALDHPVSVLLPHCSFGEVAASAARDRPKEGTVRLAADLGGGDVFVKELLQTVMAGDGVLFAAFLMELHPAPAPLHIVVFDLRFKGGVDAGEGVDMRPINARSRKPTTELVSMESSRARASSVLSTGVLPFFTTYLGPRTAWAGFVSRTWPVTSQSKSIRKAARCCFTVGAEKSPCKFFRKAATWKA